MLTVFLVVFVVMLITVAIMSIGVMFGREPIKGSCGGLNNIGVARACGCTDVCEQKQQAQAQMTDSVTDKAPEIYRP